MSEEQQKRFIMLFGAVLRMRNLLSSFDEFVGKELISERDFQDYTGMYEDLRELWRRRKPGGPNANIDDDIVFEVELIKQIEINIDYILMLVKKYHDSNCEDKEILVTINKAVNSSPTLRSKKQLIESFIESVNDNSSDDIVGQWNDFVFVKREQDLEQIIKDEKLKPEETRKFLDNAFRDGEIKTAGTDIDKLMPPVSRFGGGREKKKQGIIDKLKAFFEKFFGIGGNLSFFEKQE